MTKTELYTRLETLADERYRVFNEGLIPGVRKTFGVPIPKLRTLSKELLTGNWRTFLEASPEDTQEEILLQSMVIAQAPVPLEERMELVRNFVPKIDNWAVCDTFCTGWKFKKAEADAVWQFVLPYLRAEAPFQRRFGVVMLLAHFMTDAYIDRALAETIATDSNDYYVAMAAAWGISVAFIKYPEKTMPVLQAQTLSADVQNKAIQKIRDSRRVSDEAKAAVGALRM